MKTPDRSDFAFVLPIIPRWAEMDAIGHVNNARFFSYDECARIEDFEALLKGDAGFWNEYGLILAHIEAAMFHDGAVVAVTRGVVVWFDYRAARPLPIPDSFRGAVRALERRAPEESA